MVKKILAVIISCLLLPLSACAPGGAKLQRYEATFLVLFDTATTIVGYANSEAEFTKNAQFVYDALETYHQLYDIYHDYQNLNNLKSINDNAGIAPVKVDRKIMDLLLEAKKMYALTGGKVNIALGSVLTIWHTYREAGIDTPAQAALPPMADLRAAAKHTDLNQMILDENAATVYLKDPEMSLDVGAIAKGYATQRVTDAAREQGIKSLLISVGGNVSALGSQDERSQKPWRVGVQDPEDESKTLHILEVADKTLVTSGSYQRYYTVAGQSYHHIIDPDTLMPADYFLSVTVLAEDSGDADALSTALFNLSYEDGLKLLESMPGVEAIWMGRDRVERVSPGFWDYLAD